MVDKVVVEAVVLPRGVAAGTNGGGGEGGTGGLYDGGDGTGTY